jgi:mRNA-degrading endonuclease RelE of RelBE toxin-antitoxin system
MMVLVSRAAAKDFKKLDPPVRQKALEALQKLEADPLAGHRLQGSLEGVRALGFNAPGGAYRLAYIVDADRCLVFLIGSHEGFYAQAERRF